MNNTQSKLLLALGAITLAPALQAQEVDTSDWACEYCPFQQGHEGDYEVKVKTLRMLCRCCHGDKTSPVGCVPARLP